MSKVSIIGGGVLGSTLAKLFDPKEFEVTVFTDPDTSLSAGFGGVGIMEEQGLSAPSSGPLSSLNMKAVNDHGVRAWSQLAEEPEWQGIIQTMPVTYLYRDPNADLSLLDDCLPEQNPLRLSKSMLEAHLQAAGFEVGARFTTSIVDTRKAIAKLHKDLQESGVHFVYQRITEYAQVPECSILVDTTGIGRRIYLGDERIWAKRGQTLIMEGEHGLREVIGAPGSPISYNLVPLSPKRLLIGATKEEHSYDTQPDPETREKFIEMAKVLCPSAGNLRPLEDRVRFRPMAPTMIADTIVVGGRRVNIFNGVGGGGWSVCYGVAPSLYQMCLSA